MRPEQRAALLFFTGLAAIVWLGAYGLWSSGIRPFGPQRTRAVTWTGADMLLLAPLVIADLWQAALGREVAHHDLLLKNIQVVAMLAAFSLPVALIVLRGARPYQMGLHCGHFGRNVFLGVGSYLLATPLVAITNIIALQFFEHTPHAIEEALRRAPTTKNFLLLAGSAIIIAPGLEELLFRGILLPWLRGVVGTWRAIVLSSFIFAIAHADAWPAPIPLFVLALFLGFLASRTTSLVAPIVLHATFNAASMLLLYVWIHYHIGVE